MIGCPESPSLIQALYKTTKKSLSGILHVVEIPIFLTWGRFRIFGLIWESFQHWVLYRWVLTAPPGDTQSLKCCCWSQTCGVGHQLLEYSWGIALSLSF